MTTQCTILSMETTPTSQDMAPLFHHLHLTAPVLACAPACLATGARRVSTRKLGCGQPLASLHPGCPPQYRLCLLDSLHPTQVLKKLYRTLVNHILHYIHISSKCDKYKLPLCYSQFCRRHGGFSEHPVGEHIYSACLH